ncbi:MAG: PolC-type DNA polymerase III [Candidatus Melainabacteria bacterium]
MTTDHSLQHNHAELPAHTLADDVLIILDTETTGLDHKSEKLIEVAAVRLEKGEITETFTSLINPKKDIRHSSYLVHGIPQEVVDQAPPVEEVLPAFLEFVGDCTYVAHNALFDYSFINEACKSTLGHRFANPRIDTFEMYRSVFPDETSHGLSSMLAKFGFESDVKHRALDDAMCLARCYPRLRGLYEQKYAWQLAQLPNIEYLVERYLRLQRATQTLQSEMADLKDLFKLHFDNGGKSITGTTGETMIGSYRRNYSYDEGKVWEVALENGFPSKLFKLNPRAVDKLIDRGSISAEAREALIDARTGLHESRQVTFLKPQLPDEADEEETGAPASTANGEG